MAYDLPDSMTVECDGGLRIVRLNRPDQLNAVNAELHWALANVWRELRADRESRVVVLTGEGRAFCAGGDLDWLVQVHENEDEREFIQDELAEICFEMVRFPLPVIAAVNGPAVGLGCSVAVMCDLVLMADNAFLSDPHVSIGLTAADGGAAIWPLLTSVLRAKEYLYTGDRIPADVAVDMGLATRVVPADSLMKEALHLAGRLLEQPRYALQDTKKTINTYLAQALTGAVQTGAAAERVGLLSARHQEIIEGFRQRSR